MSAALQLVQAEPLVLAGVDCSSGFDFTLWLSRGDALHYATLIVQREFTSAALEGLTNYDDGAGALSAADAAKFVSDNQVAILSACEDAYATRRKRWL